ncbi:FadR/GntR family transcriptional regulator [Nocardioides sp.]|uniref:FadR/GntR family transcriptional regulator n=1 Tax=Nocardioides sp. TaxID=35761 RepID=UPI003D0B20D2
MTASPSADLTGAVLRPVRGHHAFEACVEQLATAIRLGVYPRDTVLPPERELAERMSVSRATLREAIAALRAAGMVQTTRGRGGGTVVLHRPRAPRASAAAALKGRTPQLLDALAFRRVVEPGAAELAAERDLDEATQRMLRDCLAAVGAAESPADHRQCDSRLHLAIATACGSRLTIAAVTQVQADLHDMLQAIPVLAVNIDHSNAQHEAIVAAILAGDARRARRVMSEHCADTAALLRGLLG